MKVKVFSLTQILLVLSLTTSPAPAFSEIAEANLSPAGKVVHNTFAVVQKTVMAEKGKIPDQELDKRLRKVLSRAFDFPKMSRGCLGTHWSNANAEEQKEFVDLFSNLLARAYLEKIKRNIENSTNTVGSEVVDSGNARVRTIINDGKEDIAVEYRLSSTDKQWRIYDIIIENVGLVSNYRTEFGEIIRKEKMSGLLTRLREKG